MLTSKIYSETIKQKVLDLDPVIGNQFLTTAKAIKKQRVLLLQQASQMETLLEFSLSSLSKNASRSDRTSQEQKAFS